MNMLTMKRHEDGRYEAVGEIPDLIYIADELLTAEGVTAIASNVTFWTYPPLRYVIRGRSTAPQHMAHRIWIAERVEEFEDT